jgi:hypothetical protein
MVTAASDKVEARLNHSERIPRITQSKTQVGGNFGDKKKGTKQRSQAQSRKVWPEAPNNATGTRLPPPSCLAISRARSFSCLYVLEEKTLASDGELVIYRIDRVT